MKDATGPMIMVTSGEYILPDKLHLVFRIPS